jgi:hypothetical protein
MRAALRFISLASLAAVLLALWPSALRGEVKITQTPASVKTRTFDPQHPPRDMPKLNRDEAAITQSKFACAVKLDVEITQVQGQKPTAHIAGVEVTLRLDVILWLPSDVPDRTRAHEEGHRQISELFYARGEKTAKELAQKYVGKTLDVPGGDPAQTQPVIQRAADEFCQQYLGQIEIPSQSAQEKYDQITEHGRNDVPEKDAIARAMKESS